MPAAFTVSGHFAGKNPLVKSIYEKILAESRKFGPVIEEPKKTSIHLVRKSAFAGVTTRKNVLILNIKSEIPIKHRRILKTEKLSASRFHQELRLTSPKQVDTLLIGWLLEAYALSG